MATIRTNGKTYDGGDVIINMLGNVANEVMDISYGEKTAHQNNHYLGSRKPSSWSEGKTDFDSTSITMSMKEQVAIENSIKGTNKRLVNIKPFWITVRYVDDYNAIVVDRILCKFTGQSRKMSIGTLGEGVQHDMHTLDIEFNV